jgi:hypothetical protein
MEEPQFLPLLLSALQKQIDNQAIFPEPLLSILRKNFAETIVMAYEDKNTIQSHAGVRVELSKLFSEAPRTLTLMLEGNPETQKKVDELKKLLISFSKKEE